MARTELAPLTTWITEAALRHGAALADHLADRLAIGRPAAQRLLKRLEAQQWLLAEGRARARRYRPGALRQVVRRYAVDGLQEDVPWRRDFAPCFAWPPEVERMLQHVFTELLNNAIEHSGGSVVSVSLRQTPLQAQLLVSDNGRGLFAQLSQSLGLDDPRLAMLELAKGKLSSAPQRHCGHGLFFASRLADVCEIHANGERFHARAWEHAAWQPGRPGEVARRPGTAVFVSMLLETERSLGAVVRAHSRSGWGADFNRTRVPLRLLANDSAAGLLASRAEARRALARIEQFAEAELDFAGIAQVGHGFADELMRVLGAGAAAGRCRLVGMAPPVAAMLAAAAAPTGCEADAAALEA